MKKIMIGLVFGVIVSVAGSIYAIGVISSPVEGEKVTGVTLSTVPFSVPISTNNETKTVQTVEKVKMENNIISPEEMRLQNIEKRLDLLESKIK